MIGFDVLMDSVVLLQRAVPHYRLRLFEELHKRFGWRVACGQGGIKNTFMYLNHHWPFIETFDFKFPSLSNPYRTLVPVSQIINKMKPDAIIAEFSLNMSSTYELIFRRLFFGKPRLVFWSHGYNMDRGLYGIKSWLFQIPRLFFLKLADGHAVYSAEGKKFLSRFISPKRIFVVPNTIDVDSMHSAAVKLTPKLTKKGPALISIGRLTSDKKFPLLISVFRKFLKYFPDATLTLIGHGPDEQPIRKVAEGLLGTSIFLEGAIYEEGKLAELFVNSDVAVFTGAVGLSVNHVLAYGLPVVAFAPNPKGPFHHPEICYVIDGVTGILVKPNTIEAMVNTLIHIFTKTNSLKSTLKPSIEHFVEEKMTLEVMLQGFQQINAFLTISS